MSLQVCPNCAVKAITWSIDEQKSPLTEWWCRSCGYSAAEDETRETDCPRCATARAYMLVKDEGGFHRWCSAGGLFESTTESFARRSQVGAALLAWQFL